MWNRREAASTLALATIFLVVALLLFPPVSSPSTRHDATLAAWYLKGEGDAILASQQNGMTVARLTCHQTSRIPVTCRLVVNQKGAGNFCSHGSFVLHGFAVAGQFTAPKRCHVTSSSHRWNGPGA